jgi:hypothetical protein
MIPVQPKAAPFSEVTKYDNVTIEQWSELKALLQREFRLPIQQNQAKIQWGSSVHYWDLGVLEWDFHQNDNPEPDKHPNTYYLEIRIRRRPVDPQYMAVEGVIHSFFKKIAAGQKKEK